MAEQHIGDFKTSVRFESFLLSLKSNLSTERKVAIWSSGAGGDTGMPGLMTSIHSVYQRGLAAWTCSEEDIWQRMAFYAMTDLLMPASENRQVQSLNIKSVHNYRVINSAAWSHIVMVFPNWEMCFAKPHCSQWCWHWLFFRKKVHLTLFSTLFSTTCFLPCSKKDLQTPVSHCLVWGLTDQKHARLPPNHMGKVCAFALKAPRIPIFHVGRSRF